MFQPARGLHHRPPHQRSGRARVFDLLEPGTSDDPLSRVVDVAIVSMIVVSLACILMATVDPIAASYGWLLTTILVLAVVGFTAEYTLRLWACTSEDAYDDPVEGRIRYALTPLALLDAFALAPFYLALLVQIVTLGSGEVSILIQVFLLLLFLKLARYSEPLRTLGRVIHKRRGELAAVLLVDLILLVAVSSAMYFVEGDVQPETFSSIPEAMWWGIGTMTSVGYGDVTPVTQAGKVITSLSALLGVALFALPAGVLGAGFVEEFQQAREETDTDDGWALPHE